MSKDATGDCLPRITRIIAYPYKSYAAIIFPSKYKFILSPGSKNRYFFNIPRYDQIIGQNIIVENAQEFRRQMRSITHRC